MIDRDHALPLTRQAELLQISRSSVYYIEMPTSAADLELMREIDRLHLTTCSPARACCATCSVPRATALVAGTW
jgi:putative transposase